MAYQPLSFKFNTSPMTMGTPSYLDAMHRGLNNAALGMNIAGAPRQMAEQLLASQLANKISSTQAKYAEPLALAALREKESSLGLQPLRQRLLEAQIKHASEQSNNPFNKLSGLMGPARIMASLDAYAQTLPGGKENPSYQKAEKLLEAQQYNQDILRQQREMGVQGFRKGETPVYDNRGKIVGTERPLTNDERKEDSGRGFFNPVYKYINQYTSYYSGEDSISRLYNDIKNFNTDKAAHDRIIGYKTSKLLVPATGVKEAATLGGSKTLGMYRAIESTLNKSDVPKKIDKLLNEFKLSKEANKEAGENFLNIINRSTEAAKNIPDRRVFYHEDYLNKKKENEGANKSLKSSVSKIKSGHTRLVSPEGKYFQVPNDLVERVIKENPGVKKWQS